MQEKIKTMKNIHVLPTDKPSRLHTWFNLPSYYHLYLSNEALNWKEAKHIYITSDEEIEDCYYFNSKDNAVRKNNNSNHPYHHKIILTTDQDLIKDGVQAIDDEFLEWFVKNPSCERVEILEAPKLVKMIDNEFYKIIIPKEETQDLLNKLIELNKIAIKENWNMSEVGEQFFKIFAYN